MERLWNEFKVMLMKLQKPVIISYNWQITDLAMYHWMSVYSWSGTELDFRKPSLTSIKLCTLALTLSIHLLYHYILFFSLFYSTLRAFNALIILPQPLLYFPFSHIRMAGPRLRETQFGGRNGRLEWLFNLGQTCTVSHSPHSTSPVRHTLLYPSISLS